MHKENKVAQDITREGRAAREDRRTEDFVLVDVLDEQYYRQSHLLGAVKLPLESVDEAEAVLPGKSAEIVLCCVGTLSRSSEEAARELAAVGYTNVRGYLEGKQDRIKAGLPYEESQD